MRSSFNHCIKKFGVNYRESRELQGKTKELETDKATDPIVPQLSKCLKFEAVWGVLN